jgi:hypothetical protein
MFKITSVNEIESDDGFSVKVEMTRLVYTEGPKKLFINSEILASPGNIAVYTKSIRTWETPYSNEIIDEQKRNAIIENIQRAFRFKGEWVEIM